MSLKILLLLSIISLKVPQKCDAKQSPSVQTWIESLHWQHQHKFRKKLRRSSPISYDSNTSATQPILLGGDIETNPGPTTTNSGTTPTNDKQNSKKETAKRKAPIYLLCEKTVHINSKRMLCTYCKPHTFTLYKHKITNAKHKCERVNLLFLCFN